MAIMRAQCAFGGDTVFPRDRMTITPHFKITSVSTDWQQLADDLSQQLATFTSNLREIVVKVYDAERARPNPPMAQKTRNAGVVPASAMNREVALCLSFYAGENAPRKRGRLYIPSVVIGGSLGVRPTVAQRDTVSQFVGIFAALGGLNVDWVVWSRRDSAARTVTNWFVDDEWDVQRRRGLRSTTRTTGTTSG